MYLIKFFDIYQFLKSIIGVIVVIIGLVSIALNSKMYVKGIAIWQFVVMELAQWIQMDKGNVFAPKVISNSNLLGSTCCAGAS